MHWIRIESETYPKIHPIEKISIQNLVVSDVSAIWIRNFCVDFAQHYHIDNESEKQSKMQLVDTAFHNVEILLYVTL